MKKLLLVWLIALATVCLRGANAEEKKPVPELMPNIADPSLLSASEADEVLEAPVTETPPPAPKKGATAPVVVERKPDPAPVAAPTPSPAPVVEAAREAPPAEPMVVKEPIPGGLPEVPADAEVAVILSNLRFYPARVRLKEGQPTRLIFTSLNQKPAALIVEQLQVQRWLAKDFGANTPPPEVTRELTQNRLVEVVLQPKRGTYTFHDALSGAVGEIIVE